jgi:PII-like signaling protein
MNNEKLIIEEDDILVKIFLAEKEKFKDISLYEYIVLKCKEIGIAGVTVTRGIMGYGADKRMHSAKLVELSSNLPIIVEIIDTEENINKLRPYLDEVINKGFITLEKIHVVKYRNK